MTQYDPEVRELRARTNCAAVLERLPPPWRLDVKESSRGALKYRRGPGEILIVSHEGRGWWDPQSGAKGDCFHLVQYLDPGLNFGQARKFLREFAGLSPSFPLAPRSTISRSPQTPAEKWDQRPLPRRGSSAWKYLTRQRHIPSHIVFAAARKGAVRDGPYGSAWFAHRGEDGAVTHVEIRGPNFKGSLKGGTKTLFRFPGGTQPLARLALTEAPIDALSLAAIENIRPDTLYAATGGGMGEATIGAIQTLLARLSRTLGGVLVSSTDANPAGDRYAARHEELARAAGAAFERMRPPIEPGDWNDILADKGQTP